MPFQIEQSIVQIKQEFPSWGAPKIRERIIQRYGDVSAPAASAVHAVLDRNGLVKRRKRRVCQTKGTSLGSPTTAKDLWCTDYEGEFMLGDRRYCYPLTVTDFHSSYLICCEAMESTREQLAITAFERLFREYGLPRAIRSENEVPFFSANA